MSVPHQSSNEGQANSAAGPGVPTSAVTGSPTNPYAPPTTVAVPPESANQLGRPPSPNLPGADFWTAAIGLTALSVLGSFFTQGAMLPIALAVPIAALRVCLIHWRRSVRGMTALAPLWLLFTSTGLMLGFGFSCTVAFCSICTGGVLAVDMLEQPDLRRFSFMLVPWMIVLAAFALGAFVFLFLRSIKWHS